MSAQRLPSLDVFRGLTIAAMVLVNNPGTWGHVYGPLSHAEWHGCTPTDLIFPFFLFIVGGGMAFWFRGEGVDAGARRAIVMRTLRRGLLLIAIGAGMAALSGAFKVAGGQATLAEAWETLRWPGVLQRIGLCSLAAGVLVMGTQPRHQIGLAAMVLAGYVALLAYAPVPGGSPAERLTPHANIVGWFDRVVLGPSHLLSKDPQHGFDPEGLLSTFPALVTTLMGFWSVRMLRALRVGSEKTPEAAGVLVALGLALAGAGWLWGLAHPINKQLWTSSYVLFTGGLAMAALGACHAMVDIWGWRRAFSPAEILGRNALFVFVGSGVVARVMLAVNVGSGEDRMPLHRWLYTMVFETPTNPELGSMLMALATVAAWWAVAWVMHQRKWYVRL